MEVGPDVEIATPNQFRKLVDMDITPFVGLDLPEYKPIHHGKFDNYICSRHAYGLPVINQHAVVKIVMSVKENYEYV